MDLVAWEIVYPMKRGLGIRKLMDMNTALLGKLLWRQGLDENGL